MDMGVRVGWAWGCVAGARGAELVGLSRHHIETLLPPEVCFHPNPPTILIIRVPPNPNPRTTRKLILRQLALRVSIQDDVPKSNLVLFP
eukprot:2051911-Rhodomonas_salina.4